jgi:hypothetical protein
MSRAWSCGVAWGATMEERERWMKKLGKGGRKKWEEEKGRS